MKQLDESDDKSKVLLRVGDEFGIRLVENPTSGFRWEIESAGEPTCKLEDDSFEPAKTIGQSGKHEWRFKVAKAGTANVELAYRRSWEQQNPPARTFRVQVQATD